jgi:CheY-like chemotaxis protein
VEAGQMDVNISETNVNNQLKYIYTFFRPEAKRKGLKLRCKTQFPTKKALLKTDKEKLYAILTNLIKNALKFTCDGSIEFGYELKEKYLEFFVKDTGIGFSPEHKEIIFERFRQVSESLTRNYEGAGLGLSISKAYVEMLGGKIWVESEQGKGSAFYFTLPYKDEQKEKTFMKNIVPANVTKSQVRNLKILIAEDDKISERLLTIAVKIFSSEVLIVKNGLDAVETCRNQPDIDLVLMDIQMPQMDGYEATRQIRQFNRKVTIIAQTAYTLASDRILAIEAGCDDYIPKPIDKALLTTLINKYFLK